MKRELQKRMQRYVGVLLGIFLILLSMPQIALAKNTASEKVRVGWYEDSYHTTGENGERSGYSYEYEQAIAAYTSWNYTYKKGSWSELLTMLEKGEIDLMGAVSYTKERAGKMLFSELPMGQEKYYLYANLSDTDISVSDLTTLNGKRVGVLRESIQTTQFCEWEEKHNVKTQHVFVDSFEDASEKLRTNQIDCVISTETPDWMDQGLSAIVTTGGCGIYFAINKNRPDLKEEIDAAMRQMEYDKPFYADDLYKKYLSSISVTALSSQEQNWLAEHGEIRIGFLNGDSGVSKFDTKSGVMTGVITDYIKYATDCFGDSTLHFNLIGFDSREEQFQALKDGGIDLIFHVSQNPYAAEQNGFILSNTVWTFNMIAVTADSRFNENEENSIAIAKDDIALKQYISYYYPKWKIVTYDSEKAVKDAVRSGKENCFVIRSSKMEQYMEDRKLHSVFLSQPGNTSFAVERGNTELLSILNKTLKTMPPSMLTSALSMYDNTPEKVTVAQFIKDNLVVVTTVSTVVLFLVMCTIFLLLKRTKKAANEAVELNGQLEKKQQELQEALIRAESANAAKTTFLNNMSHDIRTPINGIIGMLDILRKNEDDPERREDCLNKIDISSKLLLSLVNDVLDMAKLETDAVILNHETINLNEVCNEITTSVLFQAEEAGIHVTGEHDDYTEINVLSSALHLKKILMNLFTNSIKYNKPGGSIHMSMRTIAQTKDTITCQFQISDTGVGMSEEFIKNKLFQPFVQADNSSRSSYMGTGLGMPIVKQLVEKMGGSITVESTLGEGSSFTVVLPFELDHQNNHEKKGENAEASIAGMHLLIAEDNELNMEIVQFMLSDQGAQVETVSNGAEALQKFEASKPGAYDAILMDVMMPVMDGITATKKIRACKHPDAKTIPIIAMTANAFKEDEEKCIAAGMNAHLVKPLEMEKVIEVIACYGR